MDVIISVVEFSVVTSEDPLVFRIEVRKGFSGGRAAFFGRLYRLELLRFKGRGRIRSNASRWENVDYRTWVVDDNLSFEGEAFRSEKSAQNRILAGLESQLSIALPRTRAPSQRRAGRRLRGRTSIRA